MFSLRRSAVSVSTDRVYDYDLDQSRTYQVRPGLERWDGWDAYRWSLEGVGADGVPARPSLCGAVVRAPRRCASEPPGRVVAAQRGVDRSGSWRDRVREYAGDAPRACIRRFRAGAGGACRLIAFRQARRTNHRTSGNGAAVREYDVFGAAPARGTSRLVRRHPRLRSQKVPHDFRRTAIRNLERDGVPRSVAMAMVGQKTEAVYSDAGTLTPRAS